MRQLPKSWHDVLLDQFVALKSIGDDVAYYKMHISILAILTDTMPDDEYWKEYDVEELHSLIKELNWLKADPKFEKLEGFKTLNIEKILLGEWIDLDYFFQDYFTNLHLIAAIFLKQNGEEYDYDIYERGESFHELPVTHFFWLIKYFLDYKKHIIFTYSTLYGPQIEDDYEEPIEYDEEELKDIEEEKINEKWSWESVLYKLSDGDITKYDQILKMPLIFILNQLSFRKEMNL